MKLIVGLGNPGREYTGTRHNVGFDVVDLLARRHGLSVTKRDFKAISCDGLIAGQRVILAKPQTYMNLSGESVATVARYYKLSPGDIWVISDDVALPLGKVRLRLKGSGGGHNGLTNIIQHLGTSDFPRIRVGVGAARPGNLINHVLSQFKSDEKEEMSHAHETAADAIEAALRTDFEAAMNRFNIKEPNMETVKQPAKEAKKKSTEEPTVAPE